MNKGIKIAIIAIAVIAIGLIIFFSAKALGSGSDEVIAATPFEKTIEQKVDDGIKGKSYAQASQSFGAIVKYIDSESGITLADGTKNVKPEEVANARSIVLQAYAPIVTEQADKVFGGTAWNNSEVQSLGAEAGKLLSFDGKSDFAKRFAEIVNTVNEYNAANALIAKASQCATVSQIASFSSQAKAYNKTPLNNNAALQNQLAQVPAKAQSAVASSIAGRAAALRNYARYGSWYAFENAYNSVIGAINEYSAAYGNGGAIGSAISSASSAYTNAYNYFNTSSDSYSGESGEYAGDAY